MNIKDFGSSLLSLETQALRSIDNFKQLFKTRLIGHDYLILDTNEGLNVISSQKSDNPLSLTLRFTALPSNNSNHQAPALFIVGFIMGIIGGAKALSRKPEIQATKQIRGCFLEASS